MKNGFLIFLFLITTGAVIFIACKKDEEKPSRSAVSGIPEGGTITGVFRDYAESVVDSFMIGDVSGRCTSLGGFSILSSNDSYELLFFFPDVNDTGSFSVPYKPTNHLRIIQNGDTLPSYTHDFIAHISHFEEFSNYTMISGTFKMTAAEGGPNGSYIEIKDGEFWNIPISDLPPEGNKVIYQGEETTLRSQKALITDYMFFTKFKFLNEYIYTSSYGLTSFDNSYSRSSFGHMGSQIAITERNQTESTVSGRMKTAEEVDLDLNFENLPYLNFPELEDGQVALVFNFGEEIMYFDSAKYVVAEPLLSSGYIRGYKGGSIEFTIHTFFDQEDIAVNQGPTLLNQTGITFLKNEVYGYSFTSISPNNTTASFEYGTIMEGSGYHQV